MKNKTVKFQFGRGKNGQWYWRFRAANGEVIAQGEGYTQRRSALRVFTILSSAFDHNEVDQEELADFTKPKKAKKYAGTLVTAKGD